MVKQASLDLNDTSTVSIILVCLVGLAVAWVMGSRAKAHNAAVAAASQPDYGTLSESAGYDTSQSGSSGLPFNMTIAKSPLLGTPLPVTGYIDPRTGTTGPYITGAPPTAPIPGPGPINGAPVTSG